MVNQPSNEQPTQQKVVHKPTPREIELEKLERDAEKCHRDHMAAERGYIKAGEYLNACNSKATQARKKLVHLKESKE